MSRSRKDTGPVDASDTARWLRDPDTPVRYRLVDRWADAWNGRRDGRSDVAALRRGEEVPRCATVWLAHNMHLFYERDRREFLDAQALAAPKIIALQAATAAAQRASLAAQAARTRCAEIPVEPSAAELARRGPGETADSAATIAARRAASSRRTRAVVETAAEVAEQKATVLDEQVDRLSAELESLFQIVLIRSERLREHHQRRATTFLRAHRRTVTKRLGERQGQFRGESETIPAPTWTTQPCPWTTSTAPRMQAAA